MRGIEQALKEVKEVLVTINIFDSLLYSLIVLLGGVLLFSLIRVKWYFALIPFIAFFAYDLRKRIQMAKYNYVEEKVPNLKEQLITVADNLDKNNEVVDELNKDVLKKMKEVKTSYFLGFGTLSKRLLAVFVLSFFIIFASALNVHFLDFNQAVQDIGNALPRYYAKHENVDFEQNDSSIYGNKSVAELGQEEIKLQLNPLSSDININDLKDIEKKQFGESYPYDIYASSDTTFKEDIPLSYQKIVKNYFNSLTQK
ncbi:MAG: hypothetical protein Q7J54_04580 [Candidatus Woesearchaeota archaeon]|nr:hypothetical protein [Candidatus Woesearchaeota archaeon]